MIRLIAVLFTNPPSNAVRETQSTSVSGISYPLYGFFSSPEALWLSRGPQSEAVLSAKTLLVIATPLSQVPSIDPWLFSINRQRRLYANYSFELHRENALG